MAAVNPEPNDPKWLVALDIAGAIILLALAVSLVVSCGVSKPQVVVKDSVRVEVHERIVHDTAYFALQPSQQDVTTKDTTSLLKNDYAQSYAAIESGFLHHTLETYQKTIKVPYEVTVHDTITVASKENTVYVDVPRQPTKWESFVEVCGYILLGLVAAFIVAFIIKLAI